MGFMDRLRRTEDGERARQVHDDRVAVMLATAAGGNRDRAVDQAWQVVQAMSDPHDLAEFAFRMARVGATAFLEWRAVPFTVVDHHSPHVMFARRMVGYAGGDVPDTEMMAVLWNVAVEAGPMAHADSVDTLLRLVLQIVARQEDRA